MAQKRGHANVFESVILDSFKSDEKLSADIFACLARIYS